MIPSANDLSYFIELTNTLNFTRASEHIGISQPSLSIAIKRLEQLIGTALFIRHKNGITLTVTGKRLLVHSTQLMQLWDTAKSDSLRSTLTVQGCVSLGCHASLAICTLHRFLPALLNKHPHLEMKLVHDLSRKIMEGVINLSIDVGIVVNPIKHPDLIMQKLSDDKVTLWCAFPKSAAQDIHSEQAIIICVPELLQTEHLLKKMHKQHLHYRRMITSNNLEVIAQLTAAGAGIGILPANVAQHFEKLKPIPKMPIYTDE